jgi:hypothetical protein
MCTFKPIVTNKYQMFANSRSRLKNYSAKGSSSNVPVRPPVPVPVAVTVPVPVAVAVPAPVPSVLVAIPVATVIDSPRVEVDEFAELEPYKHYVGVPIGGFMGCLSGFVAMAIGGSVLVVATTTIATAVTVSVGLGCSVTI